MNSVRNNVQILGNLGQVDSCLAAAKWQCTVRRTPKEKTLHQQLDGQERREAQ